MSDMDLCNHSSSAGLLLASQRIISHGRNFMLNISIPAVLIGTIDFIHVVLLSVIWNLARGHKVSTEQNL